MSPQPTAKRLVRESLPIAGVFSFWIVLSWVGVESAVATAVRLIGIVMATAYALRRGVELADAFPAGRTAFEINLAVALAAGVWLLAALLAGVIVEPVVDAVLGPSNVGGFGVFPVDSIQFVTVGTAIATAGLYATATAVSTLSVGRRLRSTETDSGSAEPTDD